MYCTITLTPSYAAHLGRIVASTVYFLLCATASDGIEESDIMITVTYPIRGRSASHDHFFCIHRRVGGFPTCKTAKLPIALSDD